VHILQTAAGKITKTATTTDMLSLIVQQRWQTVTFGRPVITIKIPLANNYPYADLLIISAIGSKVSK